MNELMRSELRSLLDELRMIEDAMALLEAQQMTLRDQISQRVAQLGGCAVIPGFGQLELVAPDLIISYDCRELDALMQALTITHPTIAAQLRACRQESHRDDDLRITPVRTTASLVDLSRAQGVIQPLGLGNRWAYSGACSFMDTQPSCRATRTLRLRELPVTEMPRTRLLNIGPNALADAELLAILLRSGIAGANALDLARQLLADHGGWTGLLRADVRTLCQQSGIGAAKAAAIKAALEIARRVLLAEHQPRLQVKSPGDIAPLLMLEMGHLDQEQFRTVLLDTKSYVQTIHTVYIGSINTSLIRIGEVFKEALKRNSAALIVVHNHPSSDPSPSPEDVLVTRAIVEAGNLLDCDVLDHLVIGQGRWVSLRERGLGFNR